MKAVAFGDSVVWGQGLLPEHKFTTLVYSTLNGAPPSAPTDLEVFAHSGAIIGANANTVSATLDGEVPDSYPTILQQVGGYDEDPTAVDLILIDGGINDLGVTSILCPFTDLQDLQDKISQHCYQDMITLLTQVAKKFTAKKTRVIVSGYFPILSPKSDPIKIPKLLGAHGIDINPIVTAIDDVLLGKIFRQCQLFFDRSNASFLAAVAAVNAEQGGNRIAFVETPFTDDNAVFAPNAWLWGVGDDLSPQDEVVVPRHAACDLDETDPIRRLTCYRASAGHPNVIGAAQFASAITKVQ